MAILPSWHRMGIRLSLIHTCPHHCRIDLEEWEHVTCMKTVSLKSEETVSGLKGYIAVGTCLMQGEEVTCRGRVSAGPLEPWGWGKRGIVSKTESITMPLCKPPGHPHCKYGV